MGLYLRRQDTIAVPPSGGCLHVCAADSGEILRVVPVEPGTYKVGALCLLAGDGEFLVPAEGVGYFPVEAGGYRQRSEGHFQSSANPRFRVTNAMREARRMEAALLRMEVLEKRAEKREQALMRAGTAQIPTASQEVVQPAPAPEPEIPSPPGQVESE